MKLIIGSTNVFVIFDSHSRPSHPDGAVFILNTSIHRTAAQLKKILPVDRHLLSDNDLQWQAQLLANFSGHVFVSSGLDISPAHSMMESSLTILALRAEVSDLKLQNSVLSSENKRLESEAHMGDEWTKMRPSSSKRRGSNRHHSRSKSAQISNAVAGPSRMTNRHSAEWPALSHGEGDSKDRNRYAQKEGPARTIRPHFKCRICMEEHVEDNVARIDSCGHSFCRDCVRDYVRFKLGENRFPILCPVCMTEQGKDETGSMCFSFMII
jgi:hypothetical protein